MNVSVKHNLICSMLISYDTPVAFYHFDTNVCYITEKKHSKTTTKRINKWVSTFENLKCTKKVPQDTVNGVYIYGIFDPLTDEVTPSKDRFEDLIID